MLAAGRGGLFVSWFVPASKRRYQSSRIKDVIFPADGGDVGGRIAFSRFEVAPPYTIISLKCAHLALMHY